VDKLHLVFAHRGVRFALDASHVQAVVRLPELSPLTDPTPKVAGVFNLGGQLVPAVDLAICFGHPPSRLRADDFVIVMAVDGERFGVIANEVCDAAHIAPEVIEDVGRHPELLASPGLLVTGVAMREHDLAMVLDAGALLHALPPPPASLGNGDLPLADGVGACVSIAGDDAGVLRERARAMACRGAPVEEADDNVFVVFRLDAELFGISITSVHEFMHLRNIWPIPCCPRHILGNMNVRGDILTLVDLRPLLGVAAAQPPAEVVVVRSGELTVGIAVTEVMDVVAGAPRDAAPGAAGRLEVHFCTATGRFADRVFSILDIAAVLASRALRVNEEVR